MVLKIFLLKKKEIISNSKNKSLQKVENFLFWQTVSVGSGENTLRFTNITRRRRRTGREIEQVLPAASTPAASGHVERTARLARGSIDGVGVDTGTHYPQHTQQPLKILTNLNSLIYKIILPMMSKSEFPEGQ